MNELLKEASNALIANDAATLERLTHKAAGHNETLVTPPPGKFAAGLRAASEVLRRQVLAASAQLAIRRRLSAKPTPQAHT